VETGVFVRRDTSGAPICRNVSAIQSKTSFKSAIFARTVSPSKTLPATPRPSDVPANQIVFGIQLLLSAKSAPLLQATS
jgi:hypothetical protein